ncbi:site-specific DNA-methyltransferase [Leucobacter allii]|uniref:Methyltransferase n=1 Tax=Leucobacter allii TaxID=2932247 RepID=A0ABY4FJW1_9MICO|nr:site-specific DNA-methyltransferase [Leucobacter allii]UOQ56382.1 site-specific DNA-methyltransferase [Leucobacter allii]
MSDPTPQLSTPAPAPAIERLGAQVYEADAVSLLPALEPESADSLITDPPYGLGFNGNAWDGVAGFRESLPDLDTTGMDPAEVFEQWCTAWSSGALQVLRPGAYIAVFGGTRTWHRMVRGVERAGFEIRDQIAWLHSTGMPKSMDISYAIDKHHGVRRPDRLVHSSDHDGILGATRAVADHGTPVTDDAIRWAGWGTAMRPAFEPILIARKPSPATTVATVLQHGTGALNIDDARFGNGKWPTNVALDPGQADALDALTGTWDADEPVSKRFPIFRFEAKPDREERPRAFGVSHATVKPVALMRWLITLLTPPGGLILEPFSGSGSTIEAAVRAGFQVVAIERDGSYLPLIESRLDRVEDERQAC